MKEWTDSWGAIVAFIAGFAALVVTSIRAFRRIFRVADAILGYQDHPGIVERQTALEELSRQNGQKVDQVAADVADLRAEVQELKRLIAIATPTAEQARADAHLTKQLLIEHLKDGQKVMAVGLANDEALWAAARQAGLDLPDLQEYPPIHLPDE